MATYTELANIQNASGFGDLRDKIIAACAIKAVALLDGTTPTAAQIAWAEAALLNPPKAATDVMWYVIAKNAGATLAQILAANDAAVQANVNAAVDVIVSGV